MTVLVSDRSMKFEFWRRTILLKGFPFNFQMQLLYSMILTEKTHGASDVTEISNLDVAFQKLNVKGDGNCLFRSFAIHLFNGESRHFEVRKSVVEYVVKNWEENIDLLMATCVYKFYEDAKDYECFMERDGTGNIF
ncbi:hypothetical protein TSAR_008907 [Trichomalopsis sarcophagae]|uniref:OTU domain-containing protein n=1 Tax=Trichomalopsis sarcophagae TaxID=543379 RepID=A0A232EDN8_9HYME|nr:hypothetical protein TSAR_008907 [Trichomalopsis sarcophagae]